MSDEINIDFVLPWVDGGDPEWKEEFERYSCIKKGDKRNFSNIRYRDWDNLQYLFRAFEQCTPWVRKIHFVTWGHLPKWLDTSHEKINVVNHKDFLDKSYLPVFSSHPIELNLHRIRDISQRFVYFNDDTFVLKKLDKDRFFKNNLPRDIMSFNAISVSPIAHILINDLQVINRNFNKSKVIRKNFSKIFSYKYGPLALIKTLLLLPWPNMTGFFDHHQPQPFLKSTFVELWSREPEILNDTSKSKVRCAEDVNQYLFRYWQLCNGLFSPVSFKKAHSDLIQNAHQAYDISNKMLSNKYEMICINDGLPDDEFEESKAIINDTLKQIFPKACSYEL